MWSTLQPITDIPQGLIKGQLWHHCKIRATCCVFWFLIWPQWACTCTHAQDTSYCALTIWVKDSGSLENMHPVGNSWSRCVNVVMPVITLNKTDIHHCCHSSLITFVVFTSSYIIELYNLIVVFLLIFATLKIVWLLILNVALVLKLICWCYRWIICVMQDFPSFFDFSWTRNENQEGLESICVFSFKYYVFA